RHPPFPYPTLFRSPSETTAESRSHRSTRHVAHSAVAAEARAVPGRVVVRRSSIPERAVLARLEGAPGDPLPVAFFRLVAVADPIGAGEAIQELAVHEGREIRRRGELGQVVVIPQLSAQAAAVGEVRLLREEAHTEARVDTKADRLGAQRRRIVTRLAIVI